MRKFDAPPNQSQAPEVFHRSARDPDYNGSSNGNASVIDPATWIPDAGPDAALLAWAIHDYDAAFEIAKHELTLTDPICRAIYNTHRAILVTSDPHTPESIAESLLNQAATASLEGERAVLCNAAAVVVKIGPPKGDAQREVKRLLRELKSSALESRYQLVSIAELMTRPDPTWLIHKVLQAATNSVISAPHASFKSFLVLDMALCVALGRVWCGREVRQGQVVYVCAEGASGMKARIKAWCHDREEEWPERFHFIDEAVQIHNEDDLNAFIVAVKDLLPSLIIFDTLSLCALGLEENSSRDMNLLMASGKRLQDATGAHVMLIHHSSKTGGIRGSSSIPAAVQTEFELKRERDAVTLTCLKQKDGAEFKPMTFTSRLVEYDTFYAKSSLVLDYERYSDDAGSMTASEKKLYELLVETFGNAGATLSQWLKVATTAPNNMTEPTFYRARKNLLDKGKVTDGKDGQGGRGAIYRPFEATSEAVADDTIKLSNSSHDSNDSEAPDDTIKLSPPFRGDSNDSEAEKSSALIEKPAKKRRKKANSKAATEPYHAPAATTEDREAF
jgi:hypothetical protein